jgi:metal-responsive CopG/Arc/MetJ family transcriptional regulator
MPSLYSQKISVSLPTSLIQQMDKWANYEYTNRSDVIRTALLEFLRDPSRLIVTDPESIVTDKMYELIKDEHPYLNPRDEAMVKFLYDLKMSKMEE